MTGTGAEPGATSGPEPEPAPQTESTPAQAWVPPAGDDAGSRPAPAAETEPAPAQAWVPPAGADAATGPGPAPAAWPAPVPADTGRKRGIVVTAVIAAVVLLACSGLVGGYVALRSVDNTAAGPASEAPLLPTSGSRPTPAAGPSESAAPVRQGPEASTDPATAVEDLNGVCDEEVYYPQAPKRVGKAPHPVVLLVGDQPGLRRFQNNGYYYDEGLSDRVEQIWAPSDPRKVQMVACLDRVSAGSTIRQCSFDDPKPMKVPLLRASWRLRVYEVATGRKLLDKAMTGNDRTCPSVVMLFADKKIYAGVTDGAVLAALRNLVKK